MLKTFILFSFFLFPPTPLFSFRKEKVKFLHKEKEKRKEKSNQKIKSFFFIKIYNKFGFNIFLAKWPKFILY